MNFFKSVLGPPCVITIKLDDSETRTILDVTNGEGKTEKLPLFIGNDILKGVVDVKLETSKKIEHTGIKIQLLGVIKTTSGSVHEFLNEVRDLETAGTLLEPKSFPFSFETVERRFESYYGKSGVISLNYFLKVTISRHLTTNISKQIEIWQRMFSEPPKEIGNIKMEVGIEDCLHIEFEYNKSKYHLKDVIIGKIYFLLVRLKIKNMHISLIKRETTGAGLDMYTDNTSIVKFEIMDGAPVKGEAIPVRLFLGGFDLTPTYKDVCNKFSVTYILNLVLVDEDDRRYFKQREIVLWRKAEKKGEETEKLTLQYETKD